MAAELQGFLALLERSLNDERFAARLVFGVPNNASLVFVTFAPGVGFTADKDRAFDRFGFIAFASQ